MVEAFTIFPNCQFTQFLHSRGVDMASIRKSKTANGYRFYVQIRLEGHPQQSKTFSNLKEAKQWSTITEFEIRKGYYVSTDDAEKLTVANIIDRYTEEVLPQQKSKRQSISSSRIIKSHIGDYSLLKLSRSVCASYRDKRLKSVSPSTVKKEISLLSRVINVAIKDWGIFLPHGNPINSIRKPTENKSRNRRLENNELNLLLSSSSDFMKNVIVLLVNTAIRRGELCKIQFNHINFEHQTLLLKDTKNGDDREIPLTKKSIESINQLININPLCKKEPMPIVAITPDGITRMFQKLCLRLNIEDLRLHDLRHEATSTLFEHGLNIMEVSSITGHKDLKMLKRYTHLKATNTLKKLENNKNFKPINKPTNILRET